jgi:hypothetical protein
MNAERLVVELTVARQKTRELRQAVRSAKKQVRYYESRHAAAVARCKQLSAALQKAAA